jgi:hypothetical protein
VGLAFVAGNPEPLGLGLDQLKGAAGEAEEVAELFNVEAIVGGKGDKRGCYQRPLKCMFGSAWNSWVLLMLPTQLKLLIFKWAILIRNFFFQFLKFPNKFQAVY